MVKWFGKIAGLKSSGSGQEDWVSCVWSTAVCFGLMIFMVLLSALPLF